MDGWIEGCEWISVKFEIQEGFWISVSIGMDGLV